VVGLAIATLTGTYSLLATCALHECVDTPCICFQWHVLNLHNPQLDQQPRHR
jgi:hypothetical protein